mmetsp:Transcript_22730/g.26096  ORF Transcript_22730/g.26096 Transcript_22730/m.26096 type:complete len:110 (+) Transcript_22730:444-773(+)
MFHLFWRKSMDDYYWYKEPLTPINQVMRIIIMWTINIVPPLFMLFDMIFSKILFRLRHFWVGMILSVVFFGIQTIGRQVIPKRDFPSDVEELGEIQWIVLAFVGYILCH